MSQYSDQFYSDIKQGAMSSADVVADTIYGLASPASVVDLGCGQGHWAKAFQDLGCAATGVDGSYVKDPVVDFVAADLAKHTPLDQLDHYDLAISLEVAEHLPERRARSFVKDLCSLGDNVLFSAAIPGQGGTGHINEQWFSTYWLPMFTEEGLHVSGELRLDIWGDPRVEWWYQQNLMFCTRTPDKFPELFGRFPLDLVHPTLWSSRV